MTAITSLARSRNAAWIRGALLATALAGAAAVLPATRAEASEVMVRVDLGVADVIFRSGNPYYYEHGYYRPVYVEYDHWHRPRYYRYAPRPVVYHHAPRPRYYYDAPPAHYRVSYDDHHHDHGRGHDHHDRDGHHGKKGHGHDKHRGGRGWSD
ncbi:hypothetical protein H1235_02795 [Pseudoxanthomonas sp. NC8]|nr:hypothetical protein H1235_02795 [Pseudoxanthomonas sp. NC8]